MQSTCQLCCYLGYRSQGIVLLVRIFTFQLNSPKNNFIILTFLYLYTVSRFGSRSETNNSDPYFRSIRHIFFHFLLFILRRSVCLATKIVPQKMINWIAHIWLQAFAEKWSSFPVAFVSVFRNPQLNCAWQGA